MRILWICNIMLPMVAEHLGFSASNKEGWLTGLSDTILANYEDNHIQLAVAFPVQSPLAERKIEIPIENTDNVLTAYWFIEDTNHPEIYSADLEQPLEEIVNDWKPDVVHCFGAEFPHTLAITKVCPADKIMIGIQGICTLCAECYLADLPERIVKRKTFRDILKSDGIKEQQLKFAKRGENEVKAISNAGHVTGRTWIDKKFTMETNEHLQYHFMNETLRSNFYEGSWQLEKCEAHRIFLSQGDYPIKGIHYMLKALPKILEAYPDARVYVAGNSIIEYKTLKDKIKISSYGKYLRELIKKNHLEDKVCFLGKLNAEEMKEQLLKCETFVCTSVMENSPNSLGEAMLLGVPCVTAEIGGVVSVFNNGKDGIAYPGYGSLEYAEQEDKETSQSKVLAHAVLRMWSDEEKMKEYSASASMHARRTHDSKTNYKRLLEIYQEISKED